MAKKSSSAECQAFTSEQLFNVSAFLLVSLDRLYSDPSLAQVRRNPRQWHLFVWLVQHADEQGYVQFSMREYARLTRQSCENVRKMLKVDIRLTLLEYIVDGRNTIVFICNYERYVVSEKAAVDNELTIGCHLVDNNTPSEGNVKEKFPPAPPIKEKNANSEVATLQQQQQQAAGAKSPSEVKDDGKAAKVSAAVAPPLLPLEERRKHFWADCCHCHAMHREYPAEAVKSFFLFWTQLSQDGLRFKFEMETTWGIAHRMKWYVQRGRWLDEAQAAKLERIKSGGGTSRRGKAQTSDLERRRFEAADREAQAAYDRYFEEKVKR